MAALLPRVTGSGHGPRLLAAGGALLVLAGASFGLSYLPLGAWALPLALGIAAAKAAIVLLLFMELGREAVSVRLAALAALLMLLLLVTLTIADVKTRERPPLLPADETALTPE